MSPLCIGTLLPSAYVLLQPAGEGGHALGMPTRNAVSRGSPSHRLGMARGGWHHQRSADPGGRQGRPARRSPGPARAAPRMNTLGPDDLMERNRAWAARMTSEDPDFFTRLLRQQAPEYLWIGCSDSRVPANEIVDLDPGELFVHRNVANLATPQDANYLSVLQFAVDVLKVKHVIVVGHYGCGGVKAAVDGKRRGLVDHWLHPIREVCTAHRGELDAIPDAQARLDRLGELNVIRQVKNVASDVFVQDAWARGQSLGVHGWVYSLANGLVNDLGVTVSGLEDIERLG